MIVLVAIAAWVLLLLFVLGACAAARMGDMRQAELARREAPELRLWDARDLPATAASAHAVQPARPAKSDSSLLRAGSAAA
jgi:hypothetical protein